MKIHDSQHCLPQPFATGPQSSEPGTSFDPFQLEPQELPDGLKWTRSFTEQRLGWNLIVKASKPR